jgi:hypothetical protein
MKNSFKKLLVGVTQDLVCKTLKTIALSIFLVVFFFLMKDIWIKYSAKLTTFGIQYYKHDNPKKLLPSMSFCPLPGKQCLQVLQFVANLDAFYSNLSQIWQFGCKFVPTFWPIFCIAIEKKIEKSVHWVFYCVFIVTISLFTERAYNHISLQCFSLNVIELE